MHIVIVLISISIYLFRYLFMLHIYIYIYMCVCMSEYPPSSHLPLSSTVQNHLLVSFLFGGFYCLNCPGKCLRHHLILLYYWNPSHPLSTSAAHIISHPSYCNPQKRCSKHIILQQSCGLWWQALMLTSKTMVQVGTPPQLQVGF